MKSVLRSIKPYWLYLILIGKKSVEVGKDCPKSKDWNRVVELYCSKDRKSFNRIPEKDKEWMQKYLGKVVCRFVCENINEFHEWKLFPQGKFQESEQEELNLFLKSSCLSCEEVCTYRGNLPYCKPLYGWHISDLVIYDVPKELKDFSIEDKTAIKNCKHRFRTGQPESVTKHGGWIKGGWYCAKSCDFVWCENCLIKPLTSPPQSWCYVEELI